MKGILIAGTHSGVGKTTVATGLMMALRHRGLKVQPFKVGPDYIDPSYHEVAAGCSSRNLDSWLLQPGMLVELFNRAMAGKDLAVVEGVMGLYDGFQGESETGSSADVAKLLGLPVILVVDASAAARSVGAAVLGFKKFDPEVNLAGVILNGIAGEKHLEFVKPSLRRADVPLLGYLPKRAEIALPERHLGLVPNREGTVGGKFYEVLGQQVRRTIDIERILTLAKPSTVAIETGASVFPRESLRPLVSIAVALDGAFNFYYSDSLDLLRAWGSEIVPFSPLEDHVLPPGVGGVYIGGGFPEVYARDLSVNRTLLASLREAARCGMPIYGECGGLMYLGESIEDAEDRNYSMAGVFPYRSTMKGTRLTLGYRQIAALDDGLLMQRGDEVRGHEFHLSALVGRSNIPAAYRILDQNGRHEGFRIKNVLASYIHLHFASKRGLARNFVNYCARWRAKAGS